MQWLRELFKSKTENQGDGVELRKKDEEENDSEGLFVGLPQKDYTFSSTTDRSLEDFKKTPLKLSHSSLRKPSTEKNARSILLAKLKKNTISIAQEFGSFTLPTINIKIVRNLKLPYVKKAINQGFAAVQVFLQRAYTRVNSDRQKSSTVDIFNIFNLAGQYNVNV